MKDYYYILGIYKTASAEEVKKAYRKLSTKFHPDKNDGDEFFANRFKEINEAYQVLGNIEERKKYDKQNSKTEKVQDENIQIKPEILLFKANYKDPTNSHHVSFSWRTKNADRVSIYGFGEVPVSAENGYKVQRFFNKVKYVELIAENTHTGRQVKSVIKIKDIPFLIKYKSPILFTLFGALIYFSNIREKDRGETFVYIFGILLSLGVFLWLKRELTKDYLNRK